MKIERVRPDDWWRLRAARLAALRDAPDAFGSTWAEEESRAPGAWRAHLEKAAAATWLACVAGHDVGMIVGDRVAGEAGAAGLFGMWVHPDHRGRGVGDALVEVLIAWARAEGYPRLLLDVGDDNEPAERLYRRHGFEPTGVTGVVAPDRPHITEHQLQVRLEP